jgi:hypothetical protein
MLKSIIQTDKPVLSCYVEEYHMAKTVFGTGKAMPTSNTDNSCNAVTNETPLSNLGFLLEVYTCTISANLTDTPHALAEWSPTGKHQHRFIRSAVLVHDLTNAELYFTTSAGRS